MEGENPGIFSQKDLASRDKFNLSQKQSLLLQQMRFPIYTRSLNKVVSQIKYKFFRFIPEI